VDGKQIQKEITVTAVSESDIIQINISLPFVSLPMKFHNQILYVFQDSAMGEAVFLYGWHETTVIHFMYLG
jgi:hypothetical protein